MSPVAAIDCGTNSVRLLIVDAGRELVRTVRITRLGQGVDATGRFHPEALTRTFAALDEYAALLAEHGVTRVRFVATSAARDAANRETFFAGVRERIGVDAEVIHGDEEALLSFTGALSAFPDAATPALVVDIGGGSTELVLGRGASIDRSVSLEMGAVRLRERFLTSDPPTRGEIDAALRFIDGLLGTSGVDFGAAKTWIGVSGTPTGLSAIVQGLEVYDRARVHRSVIVKRDLDDLTGQLLAMTVAQVLAFPTMEPGRADVIGAGALICTRIAARVGAPMIVSEADILDGIVARLVAE